MDISINDIFGLEFLTNSWKLVQSKNSRGGIDLLSIKDFARNSDTHLKELSQQLITNNYFPEPYLQIFIRKINKNEFRPINLLTIKDKIVQTAVKCYYEKKIEKKFVDSSYAYRPEKGHTKAIRRIKDFIQRKFEWFLPIDIDNYFQSINHDLLLDLLPEYFGEKKIQNLIQMWISVGVIYNQKYIENKSGIAQGGVISPLLSNIYLNQLDHELKKRSISNVRYADNILLIGKSKQQVNEAFHFCKNYLNDSLKLKLNETNYDGLNVENGFSFCGIFFYQNFCKIAPEKFNNLKTKIANIVSQNNISNLPQTLFEHLQGLNRYYTPFDTKDQLESIIDELSISLNRKVKTLIENGEISRKYAENIIRQIDIPFASNLALTKNSFVKKIFSSQEKDKIFSDELKKRISYQKQKFQKVWYSNLDLMISTPATTLGQSQENIIIRRNGKIINQISSKNVRNLLITANGISISSNLIKMLTGKNIKVDFFDEIGNPYASIIHPTSPLQSITSEQIFALNNEKSILISSSIIIAKIRNQMSIIKYFIKNKASEERAFYDERLEKIDKFCLEIENIDQKIELNKGRDKILGFEGMAAAYYWEMVRQLIPQEFEFDSREHKNAENIVNCLLNYAYGILYTRVLSAVTLAGLNPNIGFLHREQSKKPTLVFDIIEIFRSPVADKTVIAMLNKKTKVEIKDQLLTKDTKSKLTRKVLFRLNKEIKYRGKILSLNEIILEQCRELSKFLLGEAKTFKPYLNKW